LMERLLTGSRQSAAKARAGANTKSRARKAGWGTVRLRTPRPPDRQSPPSHKTMSRSSTREPQRRPPRRPKSASMRFNNTSSASGIKSQRSTTAPLAYRRKDGPKGALRITGATLSTRIPASASARTAAARTPSGAPWAWCRWFDPSAIR